MIANNIGRLYISLDNGQATNSWKQAIEKYTLGGYHILASESLIADLEKICKIDPKNGFTIPKYLFLSSEGTIYIDDVPAPEHFEQLKKYVTKMTTD